MSAQDPRICSQVRAACAARLFFVTRPIKFSICDVVAAAQVTDAQASHLLAMPNIRVSHPQRHGI